MHILSLADFVPQILCFEEIGCSRAVDSCMKHRIEAFSQRHRRRLKWKRRAEETEGRHYTIPGAW